MEKVGGGLTEGSIRAFYWQKKNPKPSYKETKIRIAALHSDIFYCFLQENTSACICEPLWCTIFFITNLTQLYFNVGDKFELCFISCDKTTMVNKWRG